MSDKCGSTRLCAGLRLTTSSQATRRALTDRLPEAVATAVIDFLTTAVIEQPRRVGKPLRGDLAGIWSARRGTYRVLYRIREEPREVVILRIDHRRWMYTDHTEIKRR